MIEILYKDANGNRVYPHCYIARKEKAENYPTQVITNKVTLRIIPIADLEIMNDDEITKAEYLQALGL